MALQQTSLGQAVEILRSFLSAELQGRSQPNRVEVGNLADNAPANSSAPSRLNILVTRVESDGSVAGIDYPWEPWLVRLHVLITAMTADDSPSIGQNDLRLLGEVASIFHEHPILDLSMVEGIPVALNVVPENISTEALNQLWAIQGEIGFRTSLAYEVSLVPVRTRREHLDAPLVGEMVVSAETMSFATGTETGAPGHADLMLVGGGSPHFRRVERGNLAGLQPAVWVAADVSPVRLVWELLEQSARWQRVAPAGGLLTAPAHQPDEPVDEAQATDVDLPAANDLPGASAFQLVLRAIPDGAALTARALSGEPIVLSVFVP